MDDKSREILERISLKDVGILTKEDVGFLRARQSYLSDAQLEKFASIFSKKAVKEDKKVAANTPPESTPLDAQLEAIHLFSMQQLKDYARGIGMRGVHLFKDEEKLRTKIIEFALKSSK